MEEEASLPFERLDFLYMPAKDVAAEVEHFTTVLGAQLVFAIEAFGARVAMLRLATGPPDVLLADHLEGNRLAIYEPTRAQVAEHMAGRRDF